MNTWPATMPHSVGIEQAHDVRGRGQARHGSRVAQQLAVTLGQASQSQQVGVHMVDGHALATEAV